MNRAPSAPCWFVSAVVNGRDQTDRFIDEGVWEHGFDDDRIGGGDLNHGCLQSSEGAHCSPAAKTAATRFANRFRCARISSRHRKGASSSIGTVAGETWTHSL